MLSSVLLGIVLGVLAGTMTGLLPGVHTNLVAVLFGASMHGVVSASLSAVFLLSMGVTHTVTSILPNVYLGVCEGEDVVNVLPCHRLVGEGRGGDAVLANVLGGVVAATLAALYFAGAAWLVDVSYQRVSAVLPVILVSSLVYLVLRSPSVLDGVIAVAVSGWLGWSVLTSALDNALFPLLSGLFGIPLLLFGDGDAVVGERRNQGVSLRCGTAGVIGACLGFATSFLPGVGSGVASSVGVKAVSDDPSVYLSMTGAVDTADFYLSLATLLVVDKARNGVVVVLNDMLSSVSIPLLVVVGVVSVGVAAFVTLRLEPVMPKVFDVVSYEWLSRVMVCLIVGLALVLSGVRGLCVLAVSTVLGAVVHRRGVPKIVMMACIIAPVLVFLT
jgi:putative membrane protein